MVGVAIIEPRMASDFSGEEIPSGQHIRVTVRAHPVIESPVALDATKADLEKLKTVGDVVELEARVGDNGEVKSFIMTYAEFKKLVGDEVVRAAPSTRGRRPFGLR